MNLPKNFLDKMSKLMKEEYESFVNSYENARAHGLRVNTLKIDVEDFKKISPFQLEAVPWTQEGFYYGVKDKPGKHPYHEAGLYYIQEPSAMAVGTLLDPIPGERVLDLCGAPGGKSTHIAAKLQGEGFLLANEIHPARAKILSQNVERMGIRNCVVTNETPERLAQRFPQYFHRILVDAPCSGEGMFRKDEVACTEWSLENVLLCADRQLGILDHAAEMLMPEGVMVYSTCTFSPEENEQTIERFMKKHPEFILLEAQMYEGFEGGRREWSLWESEELKKTLRLWPHRLRGEGHFIAVLKKTDGTDEKKIKPIKKILDRKTLKEYFDFAKEYLYTIPEGAFIGYGEQLYLLPEEMVSLEQLRVLRPGWHLGEMKKNRFEPSHGLALGLKTGEVKNKIGFTASAPEVIRYLKGESLEVEGTSGWNLVHVDGYSLGWGKLTGNTLKNHYPKGLRWMGI